MQKHLVAERLLRDRESRDVVVAEAAACDDFAFDHLRDALGILLLLERDVKRHGATVLGGQLAAQDWIRIDSSGNSRLLIPALTRCGQRLDGQGSIGRAVDVIDRRRGDDVLGDDAVEALDDLDELLDAPHEVGGQEIVLADEPDDEEVGQSEFVFDARVRQAHRLVRAKHVFGVCVDDGGGNRNDESCRDENRKHDDGARVLNCEFDHPMSSLGHDVPSNRRDVE